MNLLELLVSFGRAGLFGFGGGPAMIPLIQAEVVALRGWLTPQEFLDAFAFGNALPGPIATKLAGYVGFLVAGWLGAVVALLALTIPTILAMVALGSVYARYKAHPGVGLFLRGVRASVIALLLLVVWDFAPSALGPPASWFSNWPLWLLALASFAATIKLRVHPAVLILVGGLIGMVFLP